MLEEYEVLKMHCSIIFAGGIRVKKPAYIDESSTGHLINHILPSRSAGQHRTVFLKHCSDV